MPLKTTPIDELPALNLTSMIDVAFLLIIFFMLSTQFIDPERDINLRLPEVATSGPLSSAPSKKVINVFDDGHITFDRKIVTLEELTKQLSAARSQYADLGVLVRGDGHTDFQSVATVLNACKEAGIAELSISVRMASSPNHNVQR